MRSISTRATRTRTIGSRRCMAWRGDVDPAQWRASAQRAVAPPSRLSTRDSTLARALLDMSDGRFADACGRYEHLRTTRDSLNFAVWYGLGDCRARDTVIVKSAASPSGYKFRSGYESAIGAYTKALTLVPTAHLAFAGVGFERLSELLFTQSRELRRGARDGDSTIWAAYPSLSHDTLAFVPYPYAGIATGTVAEPPTSAAAVTRNRALLQRLATDWTMQLPRSATAFETLARARELQGRIGTVGAQDSSALAALHQARALASNPADRRRLACDGYATAPGVRRLRRGARDRGFGARINRHDAGGCRRAQGHSLHSPGGFSARSSCCVWRRRPCSSSRWTIVSCSRRLPSPQDARALLGYASFGAPLDSLIATRERVERSHRQLRAHRIASRDARSCAERAAHTRLSGGSRDGAPSRGRRRRLSARHPARGEQARHRIRCDRLLAPSRRCAPPAGLATSRSISPIRKHGCACR